MQKAADLDERRIYDRVLEACVPIQFNGENFRKGNAVENVKRAGENSKIRQINELLFYERGNHMDNSIGKVPIHLKMTLTAKESRCEYSNIGINKNRQYAALSKLLIRTFCGQQEIGEAQRV